ncbi:acetyl-CoA synthetase-like protein [Gymnopus androsaceus JB14]|uniref:Acetyl-CoA synthetase-like protein n=1 Tax=Gymnopus androsaceus JB14 TaxID=1447944 RepID=A0A6A4H0C6_9AGAR|nr:acetyl-CoA synthetase-like protein [Gymnopus androsaceus JB14]
MIRPSYPPLENKTLPDFFAQDILQKYSTRAALICPSEKPRAHGGPPSKNQTSHALAWDFEEFNRAIDAVGERVSSFGPHVHLIQYLASAYATLQWAAARIGAILATINPAYAIDELASTLRLVGVKHLVIVPALRSSKYFNHLLTERFPALANSRPGDIQEPELPDLRNLIVVNNSDEYELVKPAIDWRERKTVKDIAQGLDKDDVINLQFTSGTTGMPKAVSLTHHNLLNNGISIGRCMNISEKDILCASIRFLGNLAIWSHGACIVYPSDSFNPAAIVNALVKEKCTALHGVPTHFLGVLAEVERRKSRGEEVDLSNLRTGIAAGTSVPIELMRRLISEMNLRDLTNAYGMTETSPVSFQTTITDPIVKRVETVGKVLPHVKAKIYRHARYWNDEEHTRQEDDSDTGILDEEGYLKSKFLRSILVLKLIHAIREAAIVAVPDGEYGEVVGAWIVRSTGAGSGRISRDDVRKMVREKMNPQTAPAWVWFVGEDGTPDELPKTASGKVMKHVLRKWSKELAERGVGKVRSLSLCTPRS